MSDAEFNLPIDGNLTEPLTVSPVQVIGARIRFAIKTFQVKQRATITTTKRLKVFMFRKLNS